MGYMVIRAEGVEDFRKLRGTWDEVLGERRSYRPYMEYDWFDLWLGHFKRDERFMILGVWEGRRPVAICPFDVRVEKIAGLGIRRVELIGNVYSPVRGIIFADIAEQEKEDVVRDVLVKLETFVDWDIIDLSPLAEEDIPFELFKRCFRSLGLRWRERFCFGNWYLDEIDVTGDEYLRSRTSNIRKNIERYKRKLEEVGRVEVRVFSDGTDEMIEHLMDAYYEVYGNSWKSPEMDSTFHRDLANVAAKNGWLRLGFVFLDNRPIATQLWLICRGVAYIVKLAYDERYKKNIPGVILSASMVKYAIDVDKVNEIDYLIGDEPYKKDWTPKRRERRGFMVFRNSLKGDWVHFLRTRGRGLFGKSNLGMRAASIIARFVKSQ